MTQKNNRFRTLNNCVPAQSLDLCGFSTSLIGYTLVAHACSLDSGHSGSRWVEQRHKGDTRGLKAQANRGFARGSWDKAALEAAGIEFLPAHEGSGLGVRLRQIARGRKTNGEGRRICKTNPIAAMQQRILPRAMFIFLEVAQRLESPGSGLASARRPSLSQPHNETICSGYRDSRCL